MIADRTFILLIVCTSLCLFCAEAPASETIRVAIEDNQTTVTLASPYGLTIEGADSGESANKLIYQAGSLGARPVRIRPRGEFIRVNGKRYRGGVDLRKEKNGRLLVINELDLEDYLKGVIAAEIPPDWESEALKAQAVASRTYALYQKNMTENRPYHIRSTVSSQVYHGGGGEERNALQAVRDTTGLVIVHQGEIIPAFYHSSCGGHTENAAELWDLDAPYLRGVDCECQAISKYGLWEKRFELPEVAAALRRQGYGVGDIAGMSIESLTPAGRVKRVAVRSARKTTLIPGEALRAALGNTVILSSFFELALADGAAVFSGRGRGHGVGLCQWGAKEMARRGHDFRSILSHYYPGTSLAQLNRE